MLSHIQRLVRLICRKLEERQMRQIPAVARGVYGLPLASYPPYAPAAELETTSHTWQVHGSCVSGPSSDPQERRYSGLMVARSSRIHNGYLGRI